MAGTKPSLAQAPGWNKLPAGTTLNKKTPCPDWKNPSPGTTSGLEEALAWIQPLAGTDPWLEQTPGWKKPLAGYSGFQKPSCFRHDLLLQKFWLPLPLEEGLKPRLRQKFCSKLPKVLQDYLCPLKKVHFFAAVTLKQSTRKRPLHFEEGPHSAASL